MIEEVADELERVNATAGNPDATFDQLSAARSKQTSILARMDAAVNDLPPYKNSDTDVVDVEVRPWMFSMS